MSRAAPDLSAPPSHRRSEGRERRVVRRAVACALAGTLIGLMFGPRIGLSVLAGAAVSVGNLLVLRRMVDGFRNEQSAGSALFAAALSGVRYLLLGAALFAIIAVLKADLIGVVCGLGAPLLAIMFEVLNAGVGAFRAPSPASSPDHSPGPVSLEDHPHRRGAKPPRTD